MSDSTSGQTVSSDSSGSLQGVLDDVRRHLARYIVTPDPLDLDALTLAIAGSHAPDAFYTVPILLLDSLMPGAGKTTVLEHYQRLGGSRPLLASSVSSTALLPRMLAEGPRTILIDEAEKSLDPKRPNTGEILGIVNSSYKRGATRPVLVPTRGGGWEPQEMPTFAVVVIAGNAPHLPDDTRSRCIRILLMPDIDGKAEESDWEYIEPDARDLGDALAAAIDQVRDELAQIRPDLGPRCKGRMREKWNAPARIAAVAGGPWPARAAALIDRDIEEMEMEAQEGLTRRPPAMVLLADLAEVWPVGQTFVATDVLVSALIRRNPEQWGEGSTFGKALTVQRFGRMLIQGAKVHSTRRPDGNRARGYLRAHLEPAWRHLRVTPSSEPDGPDETGETDAVHPLLTGCVVPECGAPVAGGECGICDRVDTLHAGWRADCRDGLLT